MNNDIKEILENVKKCCDITKDQSITVYQRQDILTLLDYITNLQERINKAIKYIESYNLPDDLGKLSECPISVGELKEILNILKGEDER